MLFGEICSTDMKLKLFMFFRNPIRIVCACMIFLMWYLEIEYSFVYLIHNCTP